jgi:hypothetical protein
MQFHKKLAFGLPAHFASRSSKPGVYAISASAAGLKADVRKLAVEVGQVSNPALTAKVQATAGSDRGPGQWPYRICSPSTATIIRTPI